MTVSNQTREHFEAIADDSLVTFEKVASAASAKLHSAVQPGAEVLAAPNTWTSTDAAKTLGRINRENIESYQQLVREPAIARVVVVDPAGSKTTYYICRKSPVGVPGSPILLASRDSKVGRLASLRVGDEFRLPSGPVEVLEQARLYPAVVDKAWDSRNTVLEGDGYGPVTIESLRALLVGLPEPEGDLLGKLLAAERQTANVREGIRRSAITKMGFRDQAILDKYQDEIFRLPLDSRLLVLGPPGTGKTTTLIRRLGQKIEQEFLDDDERQLIASLATPMSHERSWCMFTPTDLLKQFLKEAFAREGVAASDTQIRTWTDYRHELARNVLGVLRTGSGSGSFVLKGGIESLLADPIDKAVDWYTDFNDWQKSVFFNETRQAARELGDDSSKEVASLGRRLVTALEQGDANAIAGTFLSLNTEARKCQEMLAALKDITDQKIHAALNLQLNRNQRFLDELAAFIDTLDAAVGTEEDEPEDQDPDEEEEVSSPKTGRTAAYAAYRRAVAAQARGQVRKRSPSKLSRTGKIIEWLGERSLQEKDREDVGASLVVQGRLRRFVNPARRFINGIPTRYRAFRRLRQGEGRWYRKDGFGPAELHPLELDVVLLTMLRNAGELLSAPNVMRNIEDPAWSVIKPIHDLYKNQVLIDESTDFSPVQLACMSALAHPRIRSIFACGDFNQRLTAWGSRSMDDVKWAVPNLETKTIAVAYRQSRQLNEFAKAVIQATGGEASGVTLPKHVDNEGVSPVLSEGLSKLDELVRWLADRILEIETLLRQLPSIAILTTGEDLVSKIARGLDGELAGANIRAVACVNGQVMGQDNDVRIFDVQHIKGLEFEAVFFVGIDVLAASHPGLFDKYLYVGATRAAAYLGITCDGKLPASIEGLRGMFVRDWATMQRYQGL